MKEFADFLLGKFILTMIVIFSLSIGKSISIEPKTLQILSIPSKKGTITGKVTFLDGKPVNSAAVIIPGTTIGTLSNDNGNFFLKNVPTDAELVISRVGLKTVNARSELNQPLIITMEESIITLQKIIIHPAPENEPLSVTDDEFGIRIKGIDENKPPIYELDGKEISKTEYNNLNADKIEKVSLLKGSPAIDKYGDKGKNGVIVITSKVSLPVQQTFSFNDIQVSEKQTKKMKNPPFKVIEQMPQFPGGEKRLTYYLSEYLNYPLQAKTEKIEGTVIVSFVVSKTGNITDAKVIKNIHPVLDGEALKLISSMPRWNPGKQNDIPVEVRYIIPLEFRLK